MEVSSVAFQTIGFHAALILNRLRNERLVADVNAEDEERRRSQEAEEQAVRSKLALVNKRLSLLSERVEPVTSGGKMIGQTDDV